MNEKIVRAEEIVTLMKRSQILSAFKHPKMGGRVRSHWNGGSTLEGPGNAEQGAFHSEVCPPSASLLFSYESLLPIPQRRAGGIFRKP
jgi:hypothetical protein